MKTNMHFGASGQLFRYAREQRIHPTRAEELLWEQLRGNQTGFKFRRQHPMIKYVVDFYCNELKYVIEVDGNVHAEAMNQFEDENKDSNLRENGCFVQRFTNDQVINHIDEVMEQIYETLSLLKAKKLAGKEWNG